MCVHIDLEEEGTQALISAIIRTAIVDYHRGYYRRCHPDAAIFLQRLGVLSDPEDDDAPHYASLAAMVEWLPAEEEKQHRFRRAARGGGIRRTP